MASFTTYAKAKIDELLGAATSAAQAAQTSAQAAQTSASSSATAAANSAALVGAPADAAIAAAIGGSTSLTQAAIYGTQRDFTATQRFKPAATNNPTSPALTVGPDLAVYEANGNAGQRFALTGTKGDVMPYFEVVANTRTGTDGGAAVAGYQLHLGPDGGHGINREFFYIEAAGERHADGPHFRLGIHASGTGVRRPFRIENMGSTALLFDTDVSIKVKQPLKFDTQQNPIQISNTAANLTALNAIGYKGSAGGFPAVQTFLGMAEGTLGAGAAPSASGASLGGHAFGSKNGAATVIASDVRALTTEAWTFGSAQGTALDFRITRNGTSAVTRAMYLGTPTGDNYTAMTLLCQIGGVTSTKLVRIYNDGTRNLLYVA